jgi:3'-5' exonuclease
MVAHQRLPEKLTMLLQNPRVRKVGRMVNSDLKQLQTSVNSSSPFVGALDLANYAKQRHIISNARCSLADLCAAVLGKRLNKNVSERTSAAWEHLSLTTEQKHYAAIDAYVPLLLYNKLSTFSVPKCLPTTLTPLTPVLLYSTDNTVIVARGCLSPHLHESSFDGVNLTKTRTLVEISEVLVPAAIISSHEKRSLQSFGPMPFTLVCLRSHLRIYEPNLNSLGSITPATAGPSTLVTPLMDVDNPSSHPQLLEGASESAPDTGQPEVNSEDGSSTVDGIGSLLQATFTGDIESNNTISNHNLSSDHHRLDIDLESRAWGEDILATITRPAAWDTTIRSRVLKDVFHVFNMLRLSTMHGLRKEFGRTLRDILFVADKEDRMRIATWAMKLNPPKSFQQLELSQPNWVHKRCRRIIPPPHDLFPMVEKLFLEYGPLRDASTHLPLFNQQNWKTAKQILELIQQGYVSDPPGIALYSIIAVDAKADNLPIYRCSRGTNFTEGGVHTHLRSRLPTSGASVRHVNACLSDFVLQHNIRVRL